MKARGPLCAALVAAIVSLAPVELWLPDIWIGPGELASHASQPPLVPQNLPPFLNASFIEGRRFPLVLTPSDASPVSLERVAEWVKEHRPTVTGWLEAHGAVLLRGFEDARQPQQFERLASAFSDRLYDVYLGTSPRSPVNGSKFVFTASEFEPWKVVPVHCEMSFLPRPPEHLFFMAAEMPARMVGGESPLVDMRAVAREMGAATRDAFGSKGVRYVRHYPSASSRHPADTLDFFKTKPWEAMFRHVPQAETDRGAVEEEARRQGFTPSWGERGGLTLTHEMAAFRTHPTTGEQIWHNHLSVLHSSSWADEFAKAAVHLQQGRYALLARLFYGLDYLMHALVGAESLGQHVTHHGGEPIDAKHAWHARRLMWRHMLVAPWQEGCAWSRGGRVAVAWRVATAWRSRGCRRHSCTIGSHREAPLCPSAPLDTEPSDSPVSPPLPRRSQRPHNHRQFPDRARAHAIFDGRRAPALGHLDQGASGDGAVVGWRRLCVAWSALAADAGMQYVCLKCVSTLSLDPSCGAQSFIIPAHYAISGIQEDREG